MRVSQKPDFKFYEEYRPKTMAGLVVDQYMNIRNSNIRKVMNRFEGEDSRLESVKTIKGVEFINDAPASTALAVWFALDNMHKPTAWIMNISDIDMISEMLLETINQKVKKIIIQGVYNAEIIDFFVGLGKEIIFAMNLEDAVRNAFYACEAGEVVLYSPGVSAEGSHADISTRSDKFKYAISQL